MSFLTREYKFETSMKCSTTDATAAAAAAKDQRTMAMRSVKKLLRPLLRIVRKKQLLQKTLADVNAQQNAYNASLEDMRTDAAAQTANDDNLANERLEQRLYAELQECAPEAAIIVRQGQQQHLLPVPVQREQRYIPVHFARTANGTFFWTSMDMSQQQELQLRAQLDRWGQA